METASTRTSLLRIIRKVFLMIAYSSIIPSSQRYRLIKLGGVKVQGKCFIGSHVTIDTIRPDLISIGNGSCITEGCVILSHFIIDDTMYYGNVEIGKRVFVGSNTVFAKSVTVGDGALIGAGSIVTKDIPPKEVWAGNPIHYIKPRNIDL